MKRFATFISTLVLLLGLQASLSVTASATTADSGGGGYTQQECKDTFEGSFKVGSAKDDEYKKSGCAKSDGGKCKAENSKGKRQVTCTVAASPADDPAGSESCKADSDCISDPALNASARCSKSNCDIIDNYINPFIGLLSVIVGLAVVIGIIVGSIQVMTSAGDPQKAANGKNHIRDAIIALVAYVLLYAFLQWVLPGGVS